MSQGVDTRLCLPKTAWPPTYETGRHLVDNQITQVENYVMQYIVDLDEISPKEIGLTQKEFEQMGEHDLIQKVMVSLSDALIEKLVNGAEELIAHGFDFYARDWEYEC